MCLATKTIYKCNHGGKEYEIHRKCPIQKGPIEDCLVSRSGWDIHIRAVCVVEIDFPEEK
jgi:hypothetical protein